MGFDAHCRYDIRVQGEIVMARFYHTWNLEGAKVFFKDYKALILGHKFRKFGVLGDLRQYEGGTPEVAEYFEEIARWTRDHGQVARAQIIGSEFISQMIHQNGDSDPYFPIRSFEDEETALAWLADQGLDLD